MNFYVYGHFNPISDELFYIGMGIKNRAYNKTKRSSWWKRYVSKYGFEVKILYENLSKEDAIELEKKLIKTYGRLNNNTGILINLTDGGEGTVGIVRTRETRKKLSDAQRKNTHTEETKQKIREFNKGKLHSEETKKKISESMKGKRHTKETREKISKLLKNKIRSDEHTQNHKEAMRRWAENRNK